MGAQAVVRGTRLQYVVVPLEGTVKRPKLRLVTKEFGKADKKGNKKHIVERNQVLVDEPAGYMVYFPRGHCLRIKDRPTLRHYGLHKPPRVINLDGLANPQNPLNQLIAELGSGATHSGAFKKLEQAIIKTCRMRPGADTVGDYVPSTEDDDDMEQEAA